MKKLKLQELGRKNLKEFKEAKKLPLTIVLDNIRSLHNVGSLFRTSDAFLVEKIYLCGITGTPPHREIHKSALGAQDAVDWAYEEDLVGLLNGLREQGKKIWAAEQTDSSISIQGFEPNKEQQHVLIFGNEVEGVSDSALKLCDGSLEIPQAGTKHSFNVSVSAGILIWEFSRKLGLFADKT